MLSVRLPVNRKLLVGEFLESQKLHSDFQLCRGDGVEGEVDVGDPIPRVVQGSIVNEIKNPFNKIKVYII